jgi:phage-related protein
MKPQAVGIWNALKAKFPQASFGGGYKQSDPYPDHPSGKAFDVMVSGAEGTAMKNYLLTLFGVKQVLWQQRSWHPGGVGDKAMSDRGSHIHVLTI